VRYDAVASNYRPGQTADHHQRGAAAGIDLLAIQLLDVRDNLIRWESTSLMGRGEYRPSSGTDEAARALAIKQIIQQIVDGAQSQW
jgi:hypothetical protein